MGTLPSEVQREAQRPKDGTSCLQSGRGRPGARKGRVHRKPGAETQSGWRGGLRTRERADEGSGTPGLSAWTSRADQGGVVGGLLFVPRGFAPSEIGLMAVGASKRAAYRLIANERAAGGRIYRFLPRGRRPKRRIAGYPRGPIRQPPGYLRAACRG